MSESEILAILEAQKNRWFNSNELAKKTGIGICSTNRKLKRLRELKFLRFKDDFNSRKDRRYLYKFKR